MKTAEEILKSKGITESTKYHVYEYLYASVIAAMQEYASQFTAEIDRLKKENERARELIIQLHEFSHNIFTYQFDELHHDTESFLNESKAQK